MDAVLYPASWKDEILHPPNFQFILHPYYSNSSKRNKKLPLHAQKIISNVDMNYLLYLKWEQKYLKHEAPWYVQILPGQLLNFLSGDPYFIYGILNLKNE